MLYVSRSARAITMTMKYALSYPREAVVLFLDDNIGNFICQRSIAPRLSAIRLIY